MVYLLVNIDGDAVNYINEFNNNIFDRQISNLMFKDDSFIQYVRADKVLINLNFVIPKEIPFFITVMSIIVGFVFNIGLFVALGSFLTLLYFISHNIIFYLFKYSLRRKGYKGKIEAG